MTNVDELVATVFQKVITADKNRPRSQQIEIGVSSLGGCKRAVWHKLNKHVGTNETLRLSAIMGTAIHTTIEEALRAYGTDMNVEMEKSVYVEGYPKGTVDLWVENIGAVIDWKTTTKKNLAMFPSKNQVWQVQVYGLLLSLLGNKVNTVSLVGIARDGNENDIVIKTFDYDEAVAMEAIEWLRAIDANTLEPPAPERSAFGWCRNYCEFFGSHCEGVK